MLQIRYKWSNPMFLRNVRHHNEPEELDAQDGVSSWVASTLSKSHLEKRSAQQSELLGLLIADFLTRNPDALDDVVTILEPEGRSFELVQEN